MPVFTIKQKKKMFETVEEFHKILKKGGVIRVYTKSIYDNYYLLF